MPATPSDHALRLALLLALGSLALTACKDESKDTGGAETGDDTPPDWVIGEVLDTEGPGVLATTPTPWGTDLYLLRVEGTPYEMGYQHGRLVSPYFMDLWWTYMGVLGMEMGIEDAEIVDELLGNLLDSAWAWMEPNTPASFLDEFRGFGDGLGATGVTYGDGPEDLQKLPIRMVTLIDLAMSSQLEADNLAGMASFLRNGFSDTLYDYYGLSKASHADPSETFSDHELELLSRALRGPLRQKPLTLEQQGSPFNCSYFAAWGDRTDDGGLYMTRNMDFTADSGLYKYAMVSVYVPDEGVPVASVSWLGASLGVLAGMSEEGLAVSAVGASSPYERIGTEPAIIRAREALGSATNLEEASVFLTNEVGDGIVRAPTIGYNALVAWGDPRHDGAGAQAVIIENNGLESGLFHHDTDCSVQASLLRYGVDGALESNWSATDHSDQVNNETDAWEINAESQVRTFALDGKGNVQYDKYGDPIEDPKGSPIQTGYPEPCALYRGDEAMAYGVRVHQTAANGPAKGGKGLMIDSGSWNNRYWPMREMTLAYADGSAFVWNEQEYIADNAGAPHPIGIDEAEQISRVAAMGSNVWDVIYDTTDLVIRVSFESGEAKSWVRAADQPEFLELDLRQLFLTE